MSKTIVPKKKKRRRKKRKVDYTVYLTPPTVVDVPCPHTKKVQDASACSQCMSATPSIVKKTPTASWWDVEIPEYELELDLDDDDL